MIDVSRVDAPSAGPTAGEPRASDRARTGRAGHSVVGERRVVSGSTLARQRTSGRVVDVREVSRGLACDCVCPVCDTAVIARQGARTRWHFAHVDASRCRASLDEATAASFGALCRELILGGCALRLPARSIRVRSAHRSNEASVERVITTGARVSPDAVVAGDPGSGLDLCGTVGPYVLGLLLTTDRSGAKARTAAAHLRARHGERCAVVRLDPAHVAHRMNGEPGATAARTRLSIWLEAEVGGKAWVYHPRETAVRARTRSVVSARASPVPSPDRHSPPTPPAPDARVARFRCLRATCGRVWRAPLDDDRPCPCGESWLEVTLPTTHSGAGVQRRSTGSSGAA